MKRGGGRKKRELDRFLFSYGLLTSTAPFKHFKTFDVMKVKQLCFVCDRRERKVKVTRKSAS